MANFKTHFVAGATVGIALNITKQWAQKVGDPERKFDWGELAAWAAGGGVVASIPDLLEPACHPNHRSFFHSVAIVGVIIYFLKGRHAHEWSPEQRRGCGLFAYSYLSHLALDLLTKKGLPFIC